jgi:DNA repair ATPase RecN
MKTLNMQLSAIKKKFPEQGDRIETLYHSDEDFRTLCADYFVCIQNLQKFQAEFSEKQSSIEEYQSILKDLEKELQEFIFNIR